MPGPAPAPAPPPEPIAQAPERVAPGAGLSERSRALRDELAPDLSPLARLLLTETLCVAELPTGVKISNREMRALPITQDDWNYTLRPRDTPEPN